MPKTSVLTLQTGHSRVLGASVCTDDEGGAGVNFALAAPNATAVQLCLFDETGVQPTHSLPMPACTNGIWHGFLPGAQAGQVYGWRVHGPWAPELGHRFNPAKLLLDPYAREVLGHYGGQDIHWGHAPDSPRDAQLPDPRDNAALALKARVVEDLPAATPPVRISPALRVIYELHVKGFTALHPDVPPELRGTYAGLAHPAAIAHLKTLGVTTLSLMPVAFRADEERLQRLGLSNYWGYSPIAWSAPENRYWSGSAGTTPRSEFRAMVDALHAAGLELILDVVYNHTGETDELGPTLSLRGIDNASYYQLDPTNAALYLNWTGCGNCVNLNHPLVLRTVMDSLRTWVHDHGVDGFRFDLAPVLARGMAANQYRFDARSAFFMAVAQDPVLRDRLMVAEPWDIGPGGYQLGHFPEGWLEWNDRFRDIQRSAWLQRHASRADLANRLAGSADAFAPSRRAAHSSVNLVTAHDGFTLADLVSYNERHNEANGEHNRDGHGHNLSVNNGVEGPSDNPQVLAQRAAQRRVLLASLLCSLGTPLLLAGDEIGQTQGGNNNAYCQDNRTTWLRWEQADVALSAFVSRLLHLRRALPALQSRGWWRGPDDAGYAAGPVARWWNPRGETIAQAGWHHPQDNALMLQLTPPRLGTAGAPDGEVCLLLCNPSSQALEFVLPPAPDGLVWRLRLDTCAATVSVAPDSAEVLPARQYVSAQSLVLATAWAP